MKSRSTKRTLISFGLLFLLAISQLNVVLADDSETTTTEAASEAEVTSTEAVAETQPAAETEAPAETEAAPAETEAPVETEAPAVTTTEAETEAPVETEAPETEAPAEATSAPVQLSLGENECIPGDTFSAICDQKACADSKSICYRNIGKENKQSGCCGNLDKYCKATNMHTFNSRSTKNGVENYLYTKPDQSDNEDKWYLDKDTQAWCPKPFSFLISSQKQADEYSLPTGWKKDFTAKACKKNADCSDQQYCGHASNIAFGGIDKSANGEPLSFCYTRPELESNTEHVMTNDFSLTLCNNHVDCQNPQHYCLISKSGAYLTLENKTMNGICVESVVCAADEKSPIGTLTKGNGFCTDDNSCQGGAGTGSEVSPKCYPVVNGTETKLCCYIKNVNCEYGVLKTPQQSCTTISDCNEDMEDKWNQWCDSKIGSCCKDQKNSLWQCPDLATPLFNEPLCNDYNPKDVSSGVCPTNEEGLCKYGHCCPPLDAESGTQGKKPYTTNFTCDPKKPLPKTFNFAFCDGDKKKVIILGEEHVNGDKLTKQSSKKCAKNADCSPDNSVICARSTLETNGCYYNPLRSLRGKASALWKNMLIGSLVSGFICMLFAVVFLVFYRSKSVFDKYTPKKRKGKGKKDKAKGKGKKGKKEKDSPSEKSVKTEASTMTKDGESTTGNTTTEK